MIECKCGCGRVFDPISNKKKYFNPACRRRDGRKRLREDWGLEGKPQSPLTMVPVKRIMYEDDGGVVITEKLAPIPTPKLGLFGL